jgi:hypothetical protein
LITKYLILAFIIWIRNIYIYHDINSESHQKFISNLNVECGKHTGFPDKPPPLPSKFNYYRKPQLVNISVEEIPKLEEI